MLREITFMRKDKFSEEEMQEAIKFLNPIFQDDGVVFKEKIKDGSAYIEGKSFTYVKHPEVGKLYRLMGNCIGPTIYVRDILALESEQ